MLPGGTAEELMSAEDFWGLLPTLSETAVPPELAQALAQSWGEAALAEHASIASFGRFSLQLLAVGAPPALLVDTHRAALDEVEHARMCFAIAGIFAGEPLGPGPLAVEPHALGSLELPAVAAATAVEGCLGETLGVHEAEEAARLSESPAIRAALTTIARDESRHAELAWRFLGWAIATGGSATRAAVREAVAAALAQGEQGGPNARAIDEQLVPYGRLSAARRRRLRREVLERVIGPAFDELWAEG